MLDLSFLNWGASNSKTKGISGTLFKAIDNTTKPNTYYKLSDGNSLQGFYGHEACNEVIVSRLLDKLEIPHVKYIGRTALITVKGISFKTYVCSSRDFKHKNESKMTLESFYDLKSTDKENIIDFLYRYGFEDYLNQLLLVDFLIINRDRHDANTEVLYNKLTNTYRLAPIFDNGVSFVAPYQNNTNQISAFDPMKDVTVNNYIGSFSLFNNLRYITKSVVVTPLIQESIPELFFGMSKYLSAAHIQKITETIKERYLYARNQKFLCERRA